MLKKIFVLLCIFFSSIFAFELDKNPYLLEVLEQNKNICIDYKMWNIPNKTLFELFRVPICDCIMTRFMTDLKNEQFMYLRDKKIRKYISPYMRQYLQDCTEEISEEYTNNN